MEEVVRNRKSVDIFLKRCSYIPSRVATKQYRKMAGGMIVQMELRLLLKEQMLIKYLVGFLFRLGP